MATVTTIPPDMDAPEPSELEEAVLDLLEEAGIDTDTNDQIMKLIAKAEQRQSDALNFAADEARAACDEKTRG